MTDSFITPADVARRLAVQTSTIKHWLRTGKLPGVKLGKLWRVRPTDVDRFISSHAAASSNLPAAIAR